MNLRKKKRLIARTLDVGIDRIILNKPEDVKEAITRQDIRDLVLSGVIVIRPEKGRRKIERSHGRRGGGNIKKAVGERKKDYMAKTRKLRAYAKVLKTRSKISLEKYKELRKKIRGKEFKSLAYMQDYLKGVSKP